jgi:hypothetical protein
MLPSETSVYVQRRHIVEDEIVNTFQFLSIFPFSQENLSAMTINMCTYIAFTLDDGVIFFNSGVL